MSRRQFCSRRCSAAATVRPLADRFWENVNKTATCWLWTKGQTSQGYRIGRGYGSFTKNKRRILAHRYSWELHNGPIPEGIEVCHSCDTPPCVRPDHLFLGTPAENSADMAQKGRSTVGERHPAVVLTEEQVRDIHALLQNGGHSTDIARRFGVHRVTVYDILKGRTWKHLGLSPLSVDQ